MNGLMTQPLMEGEKDGGEKKLKCIGVLALQGDFAAHQRALERLGVSTRQVRKPEDLEGLSGLILPGGESTTLLKLLESSGLREAIVAFHGRGYPLFGTCAGLILLSRQVLGPEQPSLGLIDVTTIRNAYGRQKESFETTGEARFGEETPLPMVFIRAPRIVRLGEGVTPLAFCREECVMARQDKVLVAAFHPEMTEDPRVHRYFLEMTNGGLPDR